MYDILNKLIINLEKTLEKFNLKLDIPLKVKKFIVDNSYDERFGARPLKRYMTKNIENLIANSMIENKIKPNSVITFDIKDDKIVIK
ncbi:MAG: hypothetical protein NC096_02355 [Candidatus Amulumruptor caecigallinarius]|nr:hypothetical protein [Candidatus Amulumruptor caecigallinarius]